jgi:hypothetical protein
LSDESQDDAAAMTLAVQPAPAGCSGTDRANMIKKSQELIEEIKGVSTNTAFNLKTAVGCICQRCCWGARQGATTRQARACKEEQHRMAHQKRCWQVHGAVTPEVRLRKQRQDRVHAVCGKITSGQLPFSGPTA